MFKITNANDPERYNVLQYLYVAEAHMNLLKVSALNIDWETLVNFMQGRITDTDELKWAQYYLKLNPRDSAIVADSGSIRAGIVHKALERTQ